jgi:L-fuconolactonase
MRIDAHHHVWDLNIRDQPWIVNLTPLRRSFGMSELQPLLVDARIERTILVQTVTVPDETPEMLELADAHDEIAGVVGWVDLTATDVDERLAVMRDLPGGAFLVGIRHQVQEERDPDWLTREDVLRGLRAIGEAGLAYDLIVTKEQLAAAAAAAVAVPELRFVLDHAGNPSIATREFDRWSNDIATLAALPNVAVKLSGLVTNASPSWTVDDLRPYVEHVLSTFGPDRAMFGSDWPVCTLHAGYSQVVEAIGLLIESLGETEQADVFGDNAVDWYRLDQLRSGVA